MPHLLKILFLTSGLWCAVFSALHAEEYRTKHGVVIDGVVLATNDEYATFELPSGKTYKVRQVKFSPEEWQRITSTVQAPSSGTRIKKSWNRTITIDDVEVKQISAEAPFRYESSLFAIESPYPIQEKTAQRLFNTAHLTHKALVEMPLPWINSDHEGKRFQIRLIHSREEYEARTGSKNSGGLYSSRDRTVYIPIDSTGLQHAPSGYFFGKWVNLKIFVHEVTHQITFEERWVLSLPTWIHEGIAEHLEHHFDGERSIDWKNFSLRRALKLQTDQAVTLVHYRPFIENSGEQWHREFEAGRLDKVRRNYRTAFLYFYFFTHLLPPEKDGQTRMYQYLHAMRRGMKETEARRIFLFANNFGTMEEVIQQLFWQEENIEIVFSD